MFVFSVGRVSEFLVTVNLRVSLHTLQMVVNMCIYKDLTSSIIWRSKKLSVPNLWKYGKTTVQMWNGRNRGKNESTCVRILGVVAAIRKRDIPIRRTSANCRTAIWYVKTKYVENNKVRELITVKKLHTSLLNTTVVAFKILPLGSYALMPAPSPPFKTILELVLWNGLQSCRFITPDVINVIKMPSFQYFLYLPEKKKMHWRLDPVNRQGVPTQLFV